MSIIFNCVIWEKIIHCIKIILSHKLIGESRGIRNLLARSFIGPESKPKFPVKRIYKKFIQNSLNLYQS
jgi:hypothetical protein